MHLKRYFLSNRVNALRTMTYLLKNVVQVLKQNMIEVLRLTGSMRCVL